MSHQFNVRVYYEDTDLGEIVYHANFLKFTERARTEMLREAGVEQEPLKREDGVVFVVRRMEIDYLSPGRYGDLLRVETELLEMGGASLTLRQRVYRNEICLFDSKVVLVMIAFPAMKPAAIPPKLRDIFQQFTS